MQTTAGLPARCRFDFWQEAVLPNVDLQPVTERGAFSGERVISVAEPATTILTTSAPFALERRSRHVMRDQRDDVVLNTLFSGSAVLQQTGHDTAVAPGDCTISDLTQAFSCLMHEPYREARLYVPRDRFAAQVGPAEILSGLTFKAESPLASMYSACLASYVAAMPSMSAQEAETGLDGVLHLLAGLVRHTLGTPPHAGRDLSSEAILVLADRFIEGRLGDPSLGVADITRALGISRTRLYAAFSPRGGIQAAIRDARLDRVRHRLSAPAYKSRTVIEIAQGCGFTDYPSFSRAFRQRFGIPPREARERVP